MFSAGFSFCTYEGITGHSNVGQLAGPLLALSLSESGGHLLEDSLKLLTLVTRLGQLTTDQQVDGVALVGTLGALLPLQAEDLGVETEPPVVSLVAGKTSAVDTGLLASTQTNHLTVLGVAHRVALSVLEGDGCDREVTSSGLGQSEVLGGDGPAERAGSDLDVVAVLLQSHTVDGPRLDIVGDVVGVDLQDEVLAALLLLQDLQSSILETRGDDTVRDLLGDDAGGRNIDDVAESNHVSEAAHAVSSTGPGVGLSKSRGLNAGDVVDKVNLALLCGQRNANGSTGRRDVLEAGGSRLAESSLELLDQRPAVECVQQVDVARGAVQHLEGKVGRLHEGGGGLLVGVGTVAELGVLLAVGGVARTEEGRDVIIVVGRVLKSLESIAVAAGLLDLASLKLLQELGVVVRVAQDRDAGVVLGSSSDERNATDVDLLDGLRNSDVGLRDRLLEGVQVADDVVDLVNVLLCEILLVGSKVAGQDTGVDGRVKGLDATSEHLWSLGDGGNVP